MRKLNNVFFYSVKYPVSLSFSNLYMENHYISGYSDASFESDADLSSKREHVNLLPDAIGRTITINFKYYKARRVKRYVLAVEFTSFRDVIDVMFRTV